MVKWPSVKLKDVMTHRKGSILINDLTEYKLCRVQLHRRGILLRKKVIGREIKTKKQQLCHNGDLVVAEMDAKFGGYGFIPPDLEGAIVSSHYYLYELDKARISQDYFQTLISTDYIQNQIEAKGSTNYSSIRAWEFLEYEIPLPKIDIQTQISKRFLTFTNFKSGLITEHERQSSYLSKLRQAILQEAIEGKLTADWRKKHPVKKGDPNTDAAALLEQIKAEKQNLIAAGKLKKQKPLAPIKPDEIPFELPKGWVCIRLADICLRIHYGFNASAKHEKKDVRLLRITDIQNNQVDWDNVPGCEYAESDLVNYLLFPNDIVIARTGGTIGKTFLVRELPVKSLFASYLIRAIPSKSILPRYMKYFMESPYYWNQLYDAAWGAGQPNVNGTSLSKMSSPLPPLTEQQAIVERVDRLLAIVDELEQQVKTRQQQAEQLMQSVLREAFEQN